MRRAAVLVLLACQTSSPKPTLPEAGTAAVAVTITGSGTVKADGIDCNAVSGTTTGTCAVDHGAKTTTFRATAAPTFRFDRWELSRGGGPFLSFGSLPTLTVDLSLPVSAAVRGVFASLEAGVPQVFEGTVAVVNTTGTTGQTSANALFGVYNDATVVRRKLTRGEASVYTFKGTGEPDFLSAGTITMTFLKGVHTLDPDSAKSYSGKSISPEVGTPGESLGVSWPGDDIGAFTDSVVVPSSPLIFNQPQLGSGTAVIDRAKPTQLVWDPPGTGDVIIVIEQIDTASKVRVELRFQRSLGIGTIEPTDVSDFAAGAANLTVEGGDVKITNLPVKGAAAQAHVRVGTSCEVHNFQGTPLTFPENVTMN